MTPSEMTARTTVERVRDELLRTLGDVIGRGTRVALLDFPNHANVGDTAIYLGERAALRVLGCEVAYLASAASYSPVVLQRRLGAGGVVLLHGGGNLGDVWTRYNDFRERVIGEQPDRRIVLLPQTLHYQRLENARRSSGIFERHGDLHFLLRDERSLSFARDNFRSVECRLCPDAAFALGPLTPPAPVVDAVVLARTDKEAVPHWPDRLPDGVRRADWPEPSRSLDSGRTLSRALGYPLKRHGAVAAPLADPLQRLYSALAHHRLRNGLDELATARVVVTDRLHGHILALLLGRPSVLLDNSYGKNRSFYEAWTSSSSQVTWADDASSAIDAALAIAEAHK